MTKKTLSRAFLGLLPSALGNFCKPCCLALQPNLSRLHLLQEAHPTITSPCYNLEHFTRKRQLITGLLMLRSLQHYPTTHTPAFTITVQTPTAHLPHSPPPAFPWSRDPAAQPSSCFLLLLSPLLSDPPLPNGCWWTSPVLPTQLCWGPRAVWALLQTWPAMYQRATEQHKMRDFLLSHFFVC